MGFYGRSYRGRKYYFKVVEIWDDMILIVENQENFSRSKLNKDYVYSKDETIHIGDILERQYVRESVGYYSGGWGGSSGEGNTYWTDLTSYERYKKQHPFINFWTPFTLGHFLLIWFLLMLGGCLVDSMSGK